MSKIGDVFAYDKLKAPRNYSASIWSNIVDLLMGEPQTPHFYGFRILGRVQTLQNQYYLALETPEHLKTIKRIPGTFLNVF